MRNELAEWVIEQVAVLQSVRVKDILSSSKKYRYADARFIVCYILHRDLHMSSNEVGALVNRSHATVLHAVRMVEDWLAMPRLNYMAVTTVMAIEEHLNIKHHNEEQNETDRSISDLPIEQVQAQE